VNLQPYILSKPGDWTCPKCGCDDMEITHYEAHSGGYVNILGKEAESREEYLSMTCNRCGYKYEENTLDNQGQQT